MTEKEQMPKVKEDSGNQKKLTYEQLNDACNQLFQQNMQMKKRLQELNMVNMFKRLDYLFKVVEFADTFKDSEFVISCIDEIKNAMIVKDVEEKDKGKKGK